MSTQATVGQISRI